MGAMKYFRHILMDHEIFFKIFDGPRNIFLCSILIILFFKLKGLKHNPFNLKRGGKNKKNVLMHFDPDARVFVLSN